jgi:hypothetical protein
MCVNHTEADWRLAGYIVTVVSILQYVGLFLILLGVAEFFLFRHLARTKENIARRMTVLTINSLVNIIVGIVFLLVG